MATAATAQWWVRNDGSDSNGGGYDSGVSGAATNYCDQAAAQASWTSALTLVSGTLTDAGASGLFTAAMIGNTVQVSGQGYYWITGFTNSNVVTVQVGTGSATSFTTQSGKVGGALRNPSAFSTGGGGSISPTTPTPLAPGNQINIRASGSGSVGSPDYTQSSYATYPSGDTTNGLVSWVPYNGTPYWKGDGMGWYNFSFHKWSGIYFTVSSNGFGTFGVFGATNNCVWVGCTIDAQNQTSMSGIGGTAATVGPGILVNTELVGGGTSSGIGIGTSNYGVKIKNCKIHGWGSHGVVDGGNSGTQVSNSAIYLNSGHGVSLLTSSLLISNVDGCTIDSNGQDGIHIGTTAQAGWSNIVNNNITNNGTGGTGYGINVAAGAAATNNRVIAYADYNNVYNNATGNYHNLSAGAHDLSVDPQYTNAAAGHFTPANTALIAAAPIGFA